MLDEARLSQDGFVTITLDIESQVSFCRILLAYSDAIFLKSFDKTVNILLFLTVDKHIIYPSYGEDAVAEEEARVKL